MDKLCSQGGAGRAVEGAGAQVPVSATTGGPNGDGARCNQTSAISEAADLCMARYRCCCCCGCQFEALLRHCLDQLDAAAAPDSGHRDIDFGLQRQMRMLAKDLEQQDRETFESWAAVEKRLCPMTSRAPPCGGAHA